MGLNGIVPTDKPTLSIDDVLGYLEPFKLDDFKVRLLGIRGYYYNGVDKIGIYDDAMALISPAGLKVYNFNTDPSRLIPGVAVLKPGGPYMYKRGLHGIHHLNLKDSVDNKIYDQLIQTKKDVPPIEGRILPYWALRQFGNVTVLRDGKEFTDSLNNRFYIDIHKGGFNTTSSLGCQTIPPSMWQDFFWDNITPLMQKYGQEQIPYCLVDYKNAGQ